MKPRLERTCVDGICIHHDPVLEREHGVVVAFTERVGGTSGEPFASLDLAYHVGDDPAAVDENRARLLKTFGVAAHAGDLTAAEQVHGSSATVVDRALAGSGASSTSRAPVPASDALVTALEGVPLLMLFADCLPLVLVTTSPRRAVSVVHAGWRGAAAGVHLSGLEALCEVAGCAASEVSTYIGPHIMPCHYQVGPEVLAQFRRDSDTIAAVAGPLDLSGAVSRDLQEFGVQEDRIVTLGRCTAENTDRFFSYRAEGTTGRHGALAVILGVDL